MTAIPPPSLTWSEWKDILGQTIRPGDYIAYAAGSHSSHMVVGQIERINRYRKDGSEIVDFSYNYKTKTRTTTPSCTIRISPVERRPDPNTGKMVWSHEWTDSTGITKKLAAKTCQFPNKVVKVDWKPNA